MTQNMHLNTGVYIHGQVDVDALFTFTLDTLLAAEGQNRSADRVYSNHEKSSIHAPGTWVRGVPSIQPDANELPAFFGIWYRRDGSPVQTQTQADQAWRKCKNDCERDQHAPAYQVMLGFSVSLFWDDDERGWNPGNLTSFLLWNIGGWLDTNKVKWSWSNELQDHITVGYEPLEQMPQEVTEYREHIAGDFLGGLMGGVGGPNFLVIRMDELFRRLGGPGAAE